MKEYVHGLFTTEVEINSTSDCTQLYFVESIRKNFIVTDGTNSYCKGGLHPLFTSRSGLRSVFWTLLWSRNAAVTTWLHCEVVACNFICTYSDRWKYVSGGERFLCRSHILALIFVDSWRKWSQVVWGRLWHRYHRIICANVGKNQPETQTSFIIVGSLFTTYSGRFCTMSWSEISFWNNFFH